MLQPQNADDIVRLIPAHQSGIQIFTLRRHKVPAARTCRLEGQKENTSNILTLKRSPRFALFERQRPDADRKVMSPEQIRQALIKQRSKCTNERKN